MVVGTSALGFSPDGGKIELRDFEEWYADGRKRIVTRLDSYLDIADVAAHLKNPLRRRRIRVRVVAGKRSTRDCYEIPLCHSS